jgi:hypothetical protein
MKTGRDTGCAQVVRIIIAVAVSLSTAESFGHSRAALAQAVLPKLYAGDTVVVPPGQEDLLAQMLGLGAALPGDCRFTDGDADGPVIRGTYACGENKATLELQYPSNAPSDAPRTAKFAVVVHGNPPPELTAAVLSRVRDREGSFEWKVVEAPRSAAALGALSGLTPDASSSVTIAVGSVAVGGALLLGWTLRRWLSARQ